ncbi:MAG: pyridoxamine 5'-phosphate oxidase [Chloroflexi bacterium]|nr:MAG: pyridoxamine 5'-phosphate oxidase [Chloroflexota bacterium]
MANGRSMTVGAPILPDGYILDGVEQQLLPWEYVEERMRTAVNYWIGTVRPNGRPHVSPIWGIWHDGRFWFDGSPETRRGKNIAQNPHITVNLEDGTKVVIMEGVVTDLHDLSLEFRETLSEIYTTKYAAHGYSPGPETWESGIYVTDIHTVLAWTQFGVDMTRWKFR